VEKSQKILLALRVLRKLRDYLRGKK